jgi:hypothetical protein
MRTCFLALGVLLTLQNVRANTEVVPNYADVNEPNPVFCWPCALVAVALALIPDEIKFGDAVYNSENDNQGCHGEGICEINWFPSGGSGPYTADKIPDAAKVVVATTSNGEVALLFKQASDAPQMAGSTFTVKSDYKVPSTITQSLRINPYTIRKGVYPVIHKNGSAAVVFPK